MARVRTGGSRSTAARRTRRPAARRGAGADAGATGFGAGAGTAAGSAADTEAAPASARADSCCACLDSGNSGARVFFDFSRMIRCPAA